MSYPSRVRQTQPLRRPGFSKEHSTQTRAVALGSPSSPPQLVRLADSTEINAFVVDVKDDTVAWIYPSDVRSTQDIGAHQMCAHSDVLVRSTPCARTNLHDREHRWFAKDPFREEHKTRWSRAASLTVGLWRGP